ncbi:MAG: hypothetical protein R2695_22135 [Acidimicrobiales bacterium]
MSSFTFRQSVVLLFERVRTLTGRGSEVLAPRPRRRGAVAEVHPVEVPPEDELLAVALLEAAGHHQFLDLAAGRLVLAVEEHVAHVLLGDGGAALADATRAHVGAGRPDDGLEIDAGVVPEPFVLDGDHGVVDQRRNVLEGHVGAVLLTPQVGDHLPVAIDDP